MHGIFFKELQNKTKQILVNFFEKIYVVLYKSFYI